MLTFLDLYNECAGQPWSMYDAEAEGIEDLESALKISINKAISYLWNYYPWSFRLAKSSFKTRQDKSNYPHPDGLLVKKTMSGTTKYAIKYDKTFLEYAPDYELLDEATGEPEKFYIEGDYIYIYPTPDDAYTIKLSYLLAPYGLTEDEEPIYELQEENDYINIPEKYEVMFKNCLISLAMMYAIADESDENYSGYKKQYEDALNILFKYCKDSIYDRCFVW